MSAVTELWAASFEQELSRLGHARLGRGNQDGGTAGPPWGARGDFLSSLPPGYAEETSPEDAAVDWLEMSSLLESPPGTGEGGGGTAAGPTAPAPTD